MLIFLDLETTGLEESDTIVSLGLLNKTTKEYRYALVNEGKKIPPEASSIHHITKEMIVEKPPFVASEMYQYLQKYNSSTNILVSHNSNFVLQKLANAGVLWQGRVIDTLRTTKHLIPECEQFSLQFLRYELRLYKKETALKQVYGIKDALFAHHALGDALVCHLLFDYLSQMADVEALVQLSSENVLLEKLDFGKYKGHYIEEIAQNDRAYLEWMLQSLSDLDEDLHYSIEYNL